jgi:hypothetical protein
LKQTRTICTCNEAQIINDNFLLKFLLQIRFNMLKHWTFFVSFHELHNYYYFLNKCHETWNAKLMGACMGSRFFAFSLIWVVHFKLIENKIQISFT